MNMNLENSYRESLEELGYDLNEIYRLTVLDLAYAFHQ